MKLFAVPLILVLLAVAACSGGTVVTMTATASSDAFIAYRVGLTSVQLLKSANGKTGFTVLPAQTTVDFTKTVDLTELLGVATVAKGTYVGALITLDYSAAQIVYDDGSADGIALAPVGTDGKALGLISVNVALDPSDPIRSAAKQIDRLSLNFNLAASNLINLSKNTVTVTPLIAASTQPIDAKQVRIRGPFLGASGLFLNSGLMPFESATAGPGRISIELSDNTTNATTYEINGVVAAGAAGQAQLATLPANTLITTFGTLTVTGTAATTPGTTTPGTTTPGTTTPGTGTTTPTTANSSVTFAASQVLADGTAQGLGFSQLSGTVSARSGNTLGIEDATLVQNGTVTFVAGTNIVNVGANTLVTFLGQATPAAISPQEISIGAVIDAFGTASNTSTGQILLDASAGRVRLDLTSASGSVSAQGSQSLTLNLATLGGRLISAFDFVGSGADPSQYGVSTGTLDLTNAIAGAPVIASGFPNEFATPAPNFTAETLLDPTTIQAELVLDWSGGTATPFSSFDSSSIVVDVANGSIGLRHQIQIGSDIVNLVGLSNNPSITPPTSSSAVFSIGHASSSTVENFDTYTAFITQLQSELNGTTLATGMTAVGQYTASTFAFSATSITLFLNN
ncbi:MAG TPA: hypothetical protein VHS76_18300 [Steroidobacteraceae bacterium]|nr:hypothetical protein [Steroidobacteraceae bacterium]